MALGIIGLWEFNHYNWYIGGLSHCSFSWLFPDDIWCWAFFHMLICHLCILFGELPVQIFSLLYTVLSTYWIHVLTSICFENILSQSVACLSINLKKAFYKLFFLHLIKFKLTMFFFIDHDCDIISKISSPKPWSTRFLFIIL